MIFFFGIKFENELKKKDKSRSGSRCLFRATLSHFKKQTFHPGPSLSMKNGR